MDRTALTVIDGDARVSCRRLQEVLGFARIDHLHRLIKAHRDELEDFGPLFLFEGEKSGGRRSNHYYLNEHQATAICLWAETAKARAARKLIVEVFTAWRKGQLPEAPTTATDPFADNAARVVHIANHLGALAGIDDLALRVTHLPIWTNGRRPPWWHDLELRGFLTAMHRQMTADEACRIASSRFPGRCPNVRSVHRYWKKLDSAFGPLVLQQRRTA